LADGTAVSVFADPPPLPEAVLQDEGAAPGAAGGDADVLVTAGQQEHAKGDPFEHFNRAMFNAHQKFDRAVLRPLAMGYQDVVPKPVRSALHNFLVNLTEPIVFLNDLLQLKPGKALKTLGRFVFNTTLGFGGVLDIAKLPGFSLPHRDNGFGNTLGFYGVKPGPYLFLPFVGPTDLRDLFGGELDDAIVPVAVGAPFDQARYQIPKGFIGGLDERARADADLKALFNSAVDPYATLRSVYLQDRAGEIARLKGKSATPMTPGDDLMDPLADPAAGDTRSTTPELGDPLSDPAADPAAAQPAPVTGGAAPSPAPTR
ncbi:MAG: MlaA family lipoprotein, partial [Sphingomonas sp.]